MRSLVEHKSVIVTGASKGIGRGIAEVFARAGAQVLLVARNLDAAVRFLDSLGPLAERSGLEDAGAMMRVIMPQKDTVSKNQGGKKGEDREVIAAALKALGLPDARWGW